MNLYTVSNPQVQYQQNLISCVGLLQDMGVNILPVQVRLCTNPLVIVQSVLNSSSSSYKQRLKVGLQNVFVIIFMSVITFFMRVALSASRFLFCVCI